MQLSLKAGGGQTARKALFLLSNRYVSGVKKECLRCHKYVRLFSYDK